MFAQIEGISLRAVPGARCLNASLVVHPSSDRGEVGTPGLSHTRQFVTELKGLYQYAPFTFHMLLSVVH